MVSSHFWKEFIFFFKAKNVTIFLNATYNAYRFNSFFIWVKGMGCYEGILYFKTPDLASNTFL